MTHLTTLMHNSIKYFVGNVTSAVEKYEVLPALYLSLHTVF